jgi:ferrous iron transport protein A
LSNTSFLSSISAGQTVQMARIDAGRRLKHRLTELGLTPGVMVTIIQNNGGPILISVRDSRIAIGREMANKIRVFRINQQIFIPNQSSNILTNQNIK